MSNGVHGGKDDLGHSDDGGGAPPHAPTEKHGFRDYARVLRTHRNFRYLWIAETVDNVGSWLVSWAGQDGDGSSQLEPCRPPTCPALPTDHTRATWPPWSWLRPSAAEAGWPSAPWCSSASCPPCCWRPSAA